MTQPANIVQMFDRETGQVHEPADMAELRAENEVLLGRLAAKQATIDTLEEKVKNLKVDQSWRESDRQRRVVREDRAPAIRDVLLYHRQEMLRPSAKIVPDSKGWQKVDELLARRDIEGDRVFDPEDLCRSVDGAKLDGWYFEKPHRRRADFVFRDETVVQNNIDRLSESLGQAPYALAALPDYIQENVALWLSEECSCGHVKAQHVNYRSGCCGTVRSEPRWMACRCSRFAPGGKER